MPTVSEIDALLPQTQCGECDFKGCRPYAEALANGSVTIDRCPPGGVETLKALGRLLEVDSTPYVERVSKNTRLPSLAVIREPECIGCTKCIQACPVDAIIGGAKQMHTVLEHECTGCGLCVEPCPVDCIDMVSLPAPQFDKTISRERFQAREVRLLREQHEKQQLYREKRKLAALKAGEEQDKQAKNHYILQALARVQAKRNE
ncbi:RnfABCDGE type electron transport complex subunit B [Legionella impletisoli]|uniref:Iron-sulfur-binding protein n=1 Tax=Legionella impletisoli TaxID=343510 RepID=A0A917JUA4_9GAMM|nr:RnfABCDGE type electron transport complex subunit B [Legionella impletisoli]GGI86858.1 iron-sulfur-binding protein [Legionella impletisoli]